LLLLGLLTLPASPASLRAATADITLDCFTYSDTSTYVQGASPVPTDIRSGTETDSYVFAFSGSEDEAMWCQFAVPYNYDFNAGSPPTIRVFGYSADCMSCIGGACATTRYVDLEISSRAYGHGDAMNASWSTADSALMSWSSATCISPCTTNCYPPFVMKSAYADATPDASDWDIDQVVYIRILRDTSVTDNLDAKFALTQVRLQYTTR